MAEKKNTNIVVLGEALIDVFATAGVALRDAEALYPSPGGAPANVAVALARLGATVGFIGKVGVDDYGAYLIDLLTQEGVDTRYFTADPGGPTMLAVVAAPSPTEQHFILYNGANTRLTVADIPESYIIQAQIYIYSSITLAEASWTAAMQAAKWANAAGNHVIFDVNLRPLVWPSLNLARKRIAEAMATATIIKLNETELEFLTGSRDPEAGCQSLLTGNTQLCCVSLGAEGAYFSNGQSSGYVPAFPVPVSDTTGSGDAFVAGFAFQLAQMQQPLSHLQKDTLRDIIRFANACGGLAATAMGAMSASPTVEAVEQLLS